MAAIGGGRARCAFGTQSSTEVHFLRYAHKLGRSNLEYSSAASLGDRGRRFSQRIVCGHLLAFCSAVLSFPALERTSLLDRNETLSAFHSEFGIEGWP